MTFCAPFRRCACNLEISCAGNGWIVKLLKRRGEIVVTEVLAKVKNVSRRDAENAERSAAANSCGSPVRNAHLNKATGFTGIHSGGYFIVVQSHNRPLRRAQ